MLQQLLNKINPFPQKLIASIVALIDFHKQIQIYARFVESLTKQIIFDRKNINLDKENLLIERYHNLQKQALAEINSINEF